MSVGKNMRMYEDGKYEQWKEHVELTLPGLLKRNLLVKKSFPSVTPTPQATSASGFEEKPEERTSVVEIQGIFLLPLKIIVYDNKATSLIINSFYANKSEPIFTYSGHSPKNYFLKAGKGYKNYIIEYSSQFCFFDFFD